VFGFFALGLRKFPVSFSPLPGNHRICHYMTGDELIRRLRRIGRERGVEVRLDELKGKGSHAALYYGSRRTTLKDRRKEIGAGLLRAVLRQLGLSSSDLE
jgi:predicted RNA binding protein YcfA (HicA-like mRNA interferase family)